MKRFASNYKVIVVILFVFFFLFSCDRMMQETPTEPTNHLEGKSFAKISPLSGAIFTTDEDGNLVNGNIYRHKCDVYLDGGPGLNAPATAAGLPDGDYYFQVTDPSGKVLLSTDAVKYRQFEVAGGIIIGLSGDGNHAIGVDKDQGATTVQLCPFDDTPNPGGVYKVWVTPIGQFVGDINLVDNPDYFHGFKPDYSKTDNFKVGKRFKVPCLDILKFYDENGNGKWDRRGKYKEPELMSWPVEVFDQNDVPINGILFTPIHLCNLIPGSYKIVEADTDYEGWLYSVTANILDGVALDNPSRTVWVEITDSNRELIFGNTCAE